jgi:hypothetical protein
MAALSRLRLVQLIEVKVHAVGARTIGQAHVGFSTGGLASASAAAARFGTVLQCAYVPMTAAVRIRRTPGGRDGRRHAAQGFSVQTRSRSRNRELLASGCNVDYCNVDYVRTASPIFVSIVPNS